MIEGMGGVGVWGFGFKVYLDVIWFWDIYVIVVCFSFLYGYMKIWKVYLLLLYYKVNIIKND